MNLISQVSTVNSLINFVTGEQMHFALSAIGDNHFRTAEGVLRSLPKARDQAAQLRIVVSHLEGAHTAYQKHVNSIVLQQTRPYTYMMDCKKDIYTCCLLAACYAYLKEEELVQYTIEQAEVAQQKLKEVDPLHYDPLTAALSVFGSLITDTPGLIQSRFRKVPDVSIPDYKNNLLRILPELCNR